MRTANSRRYSAALKDLGERYAAGGFLCPGDIEIIAVRHSQTAEEKMAMASWLNLQTALMIR